MLLTSAVGCSVFPASSRRKKLGDPVKLIIDNRYQAIQRQRVVLGPLDQETGDFLGCHSEASCLPEQVYHVQTIIP
jgi:hypothetical protein